jgi:hypothetical protein
MLQIPVSAGSPTATANSLARLEESQIRTGAFYRSAGPNYARLLASTDDFLPCSNNVSYLRQLRKELVQLWNFTIQDPVQQHTRIKVTRHPDGIRLFHAKSRSEVLQLDKSHMSLRNMRTPTRARLGTCHFLITSIKFRGVS